MQLLSPAFTFGHPIPKKYTCQGIEISPPLTFLDIPPQAQSLALIVEDPDVPKEIRSDGLWIHWVVYNLSTSISNLAEGADIFAVQGLNTSGKIGYQGPCPPDKQHRYFFILYALDTILPEEQNVTRNQLHEVMEGHVIAEAELMGTYQQS
ncbi:YbhB/YbcL family Raf kinase inhibitor-like protein [Candidatus Chlamydia sanziniae]|uniref:Phospholipid-binding protein n=1 Tax=Candidatus Chlamydia sanziniae TaxID=1806891 RepID=A0A1A9HXB0_9CHLA|nr:YbhB/YbcL family Raf kinase inhibitor-like protein [Candidatus Chlamydia sanziniae]ANH78674.1 Phospholipid-binding protein [Candidatus Chlamydia sanziniae]